MLAFLLGSAIGVMATVSAIELWLRNALSNNPFYVTLALLAGAGAFCILDPLIPKPPEPDEAAAASSKDIEDVQGEVSPSSCSRALLGPTCYCCLICLALGIL
jgi:ZIP family zinc transporter